MRILVLDVPKAGVTLEDYAPHLLNETKKAWSLFQSEMIREIYFRKDRPGVVIIVEADSVEEAKAECSKFPLAEAGLLTFEYIPFGNYTLWQSLFTSENQHEQE